MWLLITSVLSLVIYLYIVTRINKGLPPSVSDGYYILLNKNKKLEPVFFFFMGIVGLSFLIYGLDLYGKLPYAFLIFLSGAGLCFVGAASQFKENLVKQVHTWAALICGASITLWTGIYGSPFLLVSLLFLFIGILVIDRKRFILHAELFAFANAYIQFLFLYLQGIQ